MVSVGAALCLSAATAPNAAAKPAHQVTTVRAAVYKDLTYLRAQYKWFRIAQDQIGQRQLIAPVRT